MADVGEYDIREFTAAWCHVLVVDLVGNDGFVEAEGILSLVAAGESEDEDGQHGASSKRKRKGTAVVVMLQHRQQLGDQRVNLNAIHGLLEQHRGTRPQMGRVKERLERLEFVVLEHKSGLWQIQTSDRGRRNSQNALAAFIIYLSFARSRCLFRAQYAQFPHEASAHS